MTTPTVGTVDQLSVFAQRVLDLSADLLTDAALPVPARRYVTAGRVVSWPKCEQLAVVIQRVTVGTPGAETRTPVPCGGPVFVTLQVVLHRCVPVIDGAQPIPADELAVSAAGLQEDGWVLFRGWQTLVPRPGDGVVLRGVVGPLEPISADGGVGGWRLTLALSLEQQPVP